MNDSKAQIRKGELIGWVCKFCKLYNDILRSYCNSCRAYKPEWLTTQKQALAAIKRNVFIQYDFSLGEISMTPQEELFSKFYNHEKVSVKDMDVIQLREHREELSKIAFEAKARLVASDDELRERNSKNGKAKDWLTSVTSDQASSDAINAVETRKKRMSKMDKLQQQLLAAGIDEETVKQMVKDLEKKATDSNLKTVTFSKPSIEVTAVQVTAAKPEDSKPFNPTNLTFGK